jgi:DNA-binding IscR family transcriptional regulator
MKRSSQLSDVLHVLLHMAEMDGPATSETLAATLQTNPVVLRRLMAGLRQAGFVASAKGHGGGWVLSCPLDRLTLGDVHAALGAPPLMAMTHRPAAWSSKPSMPRWMTPAGKPRPCCANVSTP